MDEQPPSGGDQSLAGRLRPLLAADAVYQNVGTPATIGAAAIVENLAGQFAVFPDSYEYRVLALTLAADGDVVLTERLDMIRTPAAFRVSPSWAPSSSGTVGSSGGPTTGT
ncbi:limonene-1,2-epoxide hydrolase family protein [Frankia tisae]|uniref:limonene-1,2-epoxide hydrolase family protein n=1 Tax=Frankia tisae TaxID=2950104 RepID=UPI0021C0FE67|nr:limonene-1,2-epoxide hydrolase family protein [Frankia tisae]